MNTANTSHLIATLSLITPTFAGDSATKPSSELDREIDRLSTSLQGQGSSLSVGALLRTSYNASGDDLYAVDGQDLGGFRFEDAQIWVEGPIESFDVRLMAKAAEATGFPPIGGSGVDTLNLREAWARTRLNDNVAVLFGQYKCPLVGSANMEYGSLLMIDRTRIGQLFSAGGAYQPGIAFFGDFDQIHGKLAVQNGADGVVDEYGFVARGEYRVNQGASEREGSLGAEGIDATIGLGYFSDGSQIGGEDFGSALALDGYLTADAFSFHGEILDMDEELANKAVGNAAADATAYSGTLGYLLTEQVEAAVRYQDLDDDLNTTLTTVGVNYYVHGHNAKWQLNLTQYEDDNDDGMLLQAGFAIGVSPKVCCSRNR